MIRSVALNVMKNVTQRMDFADNHPNWKNWFATYGPRLLLFARHQTKSLSDAEDVLQEAIVRVWKNRQEGDNPNTSAIFKAIRYAALDLGRRDSRRRVRERRVVEEEGEQSKWFAEPCPLEEKERNNTLQDAMKNLPLEQREVVVLKIWGELTFDEIGKTLNISPNTAASRYRYGLGALKKILTPATF